MFDWPDPSHTSPTRTSFTTIGASPGLLPAIVISNGPPALSLVRCTIHLPAASAVADLVWPLNLMVIFSAGSAVPQIGTGMSLCNTMWSPKSAEGFTCADAAAAQHIVMQRDARSEYVLIDFISSRPVPFPCRLCRRQSAGARGPISVGAEQRKHPALCSTL